jgi:ABC-type transporter Mla MlaB component
MYLYGSATLIRLPQLAAVLETMRPSSHIKVHVEGLDYIDHACIDLLSSWDKQHRATGGSLDIEWEGLTGKYKARSGAASFKAAQAGRSRGA